MMWITDLEVAQFTDAIIRYACLKVRVAEFGIIEHDALLAAIAAKDPQTHQLLTEFLDGYRAWFEFHKEIDQQGKQGLLSAAETARLMTLTDQKDATRERITQRLQSIP